MQYRQADNLLNMVDLLKLGRSFEYTIQLSTGITPSIIRATDIFTSVHDIIIPPS